MTRLTFKVCKENNNEFNVMAQQFIDGNPGQPRKIPKLNNPLNPTTENFVQNGTSPEKEELFIWIDDVHKPKLKLVFNATSPEDVTVTIGEK